MEDDYFEVCKPTEYHGINNQDDTVIAKLWNENISDAVFGVTEFALYKAIEMEKSHLQTYPLDTRAVSNVVTFKKALFYVQSEKRRLNLTLDVPKVHGPPFLVSVDGGLAPS